jgi:hypothetical protein
MVDLLWRNNDLFICRVIDEAITKLKARHKTHIAVYGEGNERRLTGRHETANVSFNEYDLSLTYIYKYKIIFFRLINSMPVLLIVVHQFEFLVKLVKINVDIWKIVVQHQIVIHMLLLISLCELYVLVKKILIKRINFISTKQFIHWKTREHLSSFFL